MELELNFFFLEKGTEKMIHYPPLLSGTRIIILFICFSIFSINLILIVFMFPCIQNQVMQFLGMKWNESWAKILNLCLWILISVSSIYSLIFFTRSGKRWSLAHSFSIGSSPAGSEKTRKISSYLKKTDDLVLHMDVNQATVIPWLLSIQNSPQIWCS